MEPDGKKVLLFICGWDEEEGEEDDKKRTHSPQSGASGQNTGGVEEG